MLVSVKRKAILLLVEIPTEVAKSVIIYFVAASVDEELIIHPHAIHVFAHTILSQFNCVSEINIILLMPSQ